jgi:hypothetical protein
LPPPPFPRLLRFADQLYPSPNFGALDIPLPLPVLAEARAVERTLKECLKGGGGGRGKAPASQNLPPSFPAVALQRVRRRLAKAGQCVAGRLHLGLGGPGYSHHRGEGRPAGAILGLRRRLWGPCPRCPVLYQRPGLAGQDAPPRLL